MSWLARFFGKVDAEIAESSHILPTDHPIRCMSCDSDRPMFSMVNLHSYAMRDGQLIEELTGRRVACQDCGATFSIGPHGKFKQHREAIPYSSQGPMQESIAAPDQPLEPIRPPILPMPMQRPRV